MNIEVYRLSHPSTFLVLPRGGNPPEPLETLGIEPFKRVKLERGERRIGVDTDEVLDDLAKQRWAIIRVSFRVEFY